MNYLTRYGAIELVRVIEAYWDRRGETVKCRVEVLDGTAKPVFVIRSDLVNGLPPK